VSLVAASAWILRAAGALYLVGGLWGARQAWFWARMDGDMARLARLVGGAEAQDPADADAARHWWLFVGSLMTAAAGAAMLFAHRAAVPLLAAIIIHQLLYFTRQRRRERAARSAASAEEARPARATINAFYGALLMVVLAAWLSSVGALI
jgi:hypothetical protein